MSSSKGFHHIWAGWPCWSCDQDHFNNFSFPQPVKTIYEIRLQSAQWFRGYVWKCGRTTTEDGAGFPMSTAQMI